MRFRSYAYFAVTAAGVAASGITGCTGAAGDSLPRQAVSGTVTFEGKPLEKGTIQFMPTKQEGGVATVGAGEIVEGKYTIPRDLGPVPGGYRVIISAPSPNAAAAPSDGIPGQAPPPAPDLIPPQYNANSTLNAEIKEGGPNVFDFPLKKK